jgi:hypothetical protein
MIRFREKWSTMVLYRNTQQDLFDILGSFCLNKDFKTTTQLFYVEEISFHFQSNGQLP